MSVDCKCNYETPCKIQQYSDKCTNEDHACKIKDMITLSHYCDEDICAFINHFCPTAPISYSSKTKYTPLHLAVCCGRIGLSRWLIVCKGADLNAAGKSSNAKSLSPLGLSLRYGYINLAVILIRLGADFGEAEEELIVKVNDLPTPREEKIDNLTKLGRLIRDNNKQLKIRQRVLLHPVTAEAQIHSNRNYFAGDTLDTEWNMTTDYMNRNRMCELQALIHREELRAQDIARHDSTEPSYAFRYFCHESSMGDEDGNVELAARSIDTGGDVYVFGPNKNYTIGYQSTNTPHLLDAFHKIFPTQQVKKILVDEFHSVILTTSGKVFSCGHGKGGRLGHCDENSSVDYKEITIPTNNTVLDFSLARDHTVFLLDSGEIYSCGLNTHMVLGIMPPPSHIDTPQRLKFSRRNLNAMGVSCSRYHTVSWNSHEIYAWGHNGGQMGFDCNESIFIGSPKKVYGFHLKERDQIQRITTSIGSTIVATKMGEVYAFQNFKITKIFSAYTEIASIIAIGGQIYLDDLPVENKDLSVAILNKVGEVSYWHSCMKNSRTPELIAEHCKGIAFVGSGNDLMTINEEGRIFQMQLRICSELLRNANQEPNIDVVNFRINEGPVKVTNKVIRKLPAAKYVTCDPTGVNVAVIVENPMRSMPDLIKVPLSNMNADLLNLMNASCAEDNLHDVVVITSEKTYYAHRYILAKRSKYFRTVLQENTHKVVIDNKKVNPLIFDRIMTFIYSSNIDISNPGPIPSDLLHLTKISKNEPVIIDLTKKDHYKILKQIDKEQHTTNYTDPLYMARAAGDIYRIHGINELFSEVILVNGVVYKIQRDDSYCDRKEFDFRGHWYEFPEYHDVEIFCSDGVVIKAHKCILQARSEYFVPLFSGVWQENTRGSKLSKVTFDYSSEIVQHALYYIYTDEVPELYKLDINTVFSLLKFADNYDLQRLVDICTHALSCRITYKNTVQILQIAYWLFRASHLRDFCYEFISRHLEVFLENRYLECLDDSILLDITKYYQSWHPNVLCSELSDEVPVDADRIRSIIEKYPVDIQHQLENVRVPQKSPSTLKNQRKRVKSHRKSESKVGDLDSSFEEAGKTSRTDRDWQRTMNECFEADPYPGSGPNSLFGTSAIVGSPLACSPISCSPIGAASVGTSPIANGPIGTSGFASIINAASIGGSSIGGSSIGGASSGGVSIRNPFIGSSAGGFSSNSINAGAGSSHVGSPIAGSSIAKSLFPSSSTAGSSIDASLRASTSDGRSSQPKGSVSRVEAILAAAELMKTQDDLIDYSVLSPQTKPHSLVEEFPELGSQRSPKVAVEKSPVKPQGEKRDKKFRISQRERKQQMEEKAQEASSPKAPPKNPWKIPEAPSPSSPTEAKVDFNKIVNHEKKQKENFAKMKSKLLAYTLMEDKALEELSRFYNVANAVDEIITVERVQIDIMSEPVWVPRTKAQMPRSDFCSL